MTEQVHRPSAWRTAVIFVFSVIGAIAVCNFEWFGASWGVVAAAALLVATPLLNRRASLAPQLIARAAWWQGMVVGTAMFLGTGMGVGAVLAVASLGAVIAGGKIGLDNHSAAFVPVAYRRTLMASLILGLADLTALIVYFAVFVETAYYWGAESVVLAPSIALLAAAALAMGIAVTGLFRLRMWGLVACVVANVAIATLALSGAFGLESFLAVGLGVTALAQLVIPVPLLRGMWKTHRLAA